jgi:hypothetical protein
MINDICAYAHTSAELIDALNELVVRIDQQIRVSADEQTQRAFKEVYNKVIELQTVMMEKENAK